MVVIAEDCQKFLEIATLDLTVPVCNQHLYIQNRFALYLDKTFGPLTSSTTRK